MQRLKRQNRKSNKSTGTAGVILTARPLQGTNRVITDWTSVKVSLPENLQDRLKGIKETDENIRKQKNSEMRSLSNSTVGNF